MNKTIKRTLAIVMAVAMLFALSATAFADNDITVYVRVQTATSGTGYDQLANLTNIVDCTYYTGETSVNYGGFSYIAVSVSTGATVKDLVEAMNRVTIVDEETCDCEGCTHTDYGCTCTDSDCNCTWRQVQNVDSNYNPIPNSYSSAMRSLKYNGTTRTQNVVTSTSNSWAGNSWSYYVDGGYPETLYMSQYVLAAGQHIALSYDYSSFSW